MYAELGVTGNPFVQTTVGQMEIRAYWNSGLLAASAAPACSAPGSGR